TRAVRRQVPGSIRRVNCELPYVVVKSPHWNGNVVRSIRRSFKRAVALVVRAALWHRGKDVQRSQRSTATALEPVNSGINQRTVRRICEGVAATPRSSRVDSDLSR